MTLHIAVQRKETGMSDMRSSPKCNKFLCEDIIAPRLSFNISKMQMRIWSVNLKSMPVILF